MKKIVLLFFLVLLLVTPTASYAAEYNGDIHIYSTLQVYFNGKEDVSGENGKFFNGEKNVPKTMIYKGTTYVPIRYFSNMMGIKDLGWDGEAKLIWVNSKKPEVIGIGDESKSITVIETYMQTDHKYNDVVKVNFYPNLRMYFNGVEDNTGSRDYFNNGLDDVPKTLNYEGTTYIPLRYFAVQLGISNENIQWDNTTPKLSIEWLND